MLYLSDLSTNAIILIGLFALATGVLHGVTGMAGGIVMAAILAHFIDIKLAIPVMSCALLISHSSRVYFYRADIPWPIVKQVLIFAVPGIIAGAMLFSYLDGRVIAGVMALFLIMSFPIKAYTRKRKLKTSSKLLAFVSILWGFLAGNVIGPGFMLIPFLLGTGINRMAFVGCLATIVLTINIIKLSVFSMTGLVNLDVILLGLFIGLLSVPGNWQGRKLLITMSDQRHRIILDIMTVMVIINFIYLRELCIIATSRAF